MMNEKKEIGRYEIRRKIGAGGMGEVYLAHDTQLNRPVALKILPKEFSEDDIRRHRFKQEARAVSALNHPNIITIYEIGESDDGWFIATEYVEGETLRQYLKDSPLRIVQAVRIAEQIAQALVAAHEAGIVHRDIKPENIMIRRDGYVKVLDFGLAKPTDAQSENDSGNTTSQIVHTQPGMVMGSVRYMSPEQARGRAVDGRTDVWSLGVVLYEMLTGQIPFRGETTGDTLASVIHLEPAPLVRLAPNAPAELERIVRKALQKQAGERYQSVKDLALDLKNLLYDIEHEISLENQKQIRSNPSGADNADITENPTMIHHTSGAAQNTSGANHPTQFSAAIQTSIAEYVVAQVKTYKHGILALLGLIVVGAAALFAYRVWFVEKPKQAATAFEKTQVSRLETGVSVRTPAISPDGRYVAYVNFDSASQSLVVRQISTNSEMTIVPPNPQGFAALTFSPAGDRVFYTQTSADSTLNTLYQIPTLGGVPKKVVEDVDSTVTFSPDAKRLAFMRNVSIDGTSMIYVADTDGANLQPLISTKQTEFKSFASPAWSPDGAKILVVAGADRDNSTYNVKIAEISVADGSFKTLSAKSWSSISRINWLKDSSGFMAIGKENEEMPWQIWRFAYPSVEAKQITNDSNDYGNLSLAADGETLVTIRSDSVMSLWSFTPAKNELTQIVPERRNLFWDTRIEQTPDGKLIFSRREGAEVNIWTMDADGKNERQLIADARATSPPVVTSDGRFIVFASERSAAGDSRIWRSDADGKNLKQLTEGDDNQKDYNPRVAVDGKDIFFNRQMGGDLNKSVLAKVPLDGGSVETIFDQENFNSFNPLPSPDGKRLACYLFNRGNIKKTIGIISLEESGTKEIEKSLSSDFVSNFIWSPDGKSLTYSRWDNNSALWKMPIDGGKPEILADFKAGRIFNFAWSRDGQKLFLVRGIINNDLVLIRNAAGKNSN